MYYTIYYFFSPINNNKHFEGSCELLSKHYDVMSVSVISIMQTAI